MNNHSGRDTAGLTACIYFVYHIQRAHRKPDSKHQLADQDGSKI